MAAKEKEKDSKPGPDLTKVKRFVRSLPYHYLKPFLGLFLGYILIAFPILIGLVALGFITHLPLNNLQSWLMALGAAAVAGGSLFIAYHLFRVNPKLPNGVNITQEQFPKIFNMLDDLKRDFKGVKIDRVIFTLDHDIRVVKTPIFGIPFWYKTSLLIGFPVLFMVNADQFMALLSRRYGQNALSLNLLTTWPVHFRSIWRDYLQVYKEKKKFYRFPALGMAVFCKIYDKLSNFMLNKEELDGDNHALKIYNDEDTLVTIEQYTASRIFLEHNLIPKLNKLPPGTPQNQNPLMIMAKQMKVFLAKAEGNKWISACLQKRVFGQHYPTLQERMENIGHMKPIQLPVQDNMAAEEILGKNLAPLIGSMHKMWQQRAAMYQMAASKQTKASKKKAKA